jgi:hypothetical protein
MPIIRDGGFCSYQGKGCRMDVSGVSQSIQSVNDVMMFAEAKSTKMAEKLVRMNVELATKTPSANPNVGNNLDISV